MILNFLILFIFINYRSTDMAEQDMLQLQTQVGGAHTIVDWKNFCRDVCVEYIITHPIHIGGPGHVVEIDECQLVRRKYNVGHLVQEQWVFGGIDPATNEGFLIPVPDRTRPTLEALIIEYIRPGTTIHSDQWAAYGNLANLVNPATGLNMGYTHLTVNHRHNFVDPITGATTNHIESMWYKILKFNVYIYLLWLSFRYYIDMLIK